MADKKDHNEKNIIIPLLILTGFLFLAGLLPFNQFWGFNHLKYFSTLGIIGFAVIAALIFISPVRQVIIRLAAKSYALFSSLTRPIQYIVIGTISVIAFYIFRVHVHSLGDGYMRIGQIESGIRYLHTEPLDFWLHGVLYDFLNKFGTFTGEAIYQIYSISVGVIFVLLIYGFRLSNKDSFSDFGLFKWLVISLGGLQLFFGYVESYALHYSAMLLFLLYSWKYIRTGKGLIISTICFAVAISSHVTGFVFFPAYLYLVYISFRHYRSNNNLAKLISVASIGAISIAFVISEYNVRSEYGQYLGSMSHYFLPLIGNGYAVLSGHHLIDLLNQLLLILPVPIMMSLGFIKIGQNHDKKCLIFLLLLSIIALLFMIVIDPKLGYARDWDLFATSAGVLGCVLIILLYNKWRNIPNSTKYIPVCLSILILSSWILTNATVDRQLKRAEDLLELSDQGRGYCTELLAHYYRYEAKDNQKVLDLLNSITGEAKNARVYRFIAVTEHEMNRPAAALKSARHGLKLDSTVAEINYIAGLSLEKLGHDDSALHYLERARYYDPGSYLYMTTLARSYFKNKQPVVAAEAYKHAINLGPEHPNTYFDIGFIYLNLGQLDSALVYTQKGLKIAPDYESGYELLNAIKRAADNKLNP